jgi:hypothetical protein
MHRLILLCSAAALLAGSGIVHGLWTDRWAEPVDLTGAAARLKHVPTTVGAWQGADLEMKHNPNLNLAGVLTRRYVNRDTGAVVTIYLACGRPGPVCVHSPDVCYEANGFKLDRPRRFQLDADRTAGPELWTAGAVREKTAGAEYLRLFWSWHAADGWRISDSPRLAFAGESHLHKLYVIRELANPNEPMNAEPCVEFMRAFLPALQAALFDPEPR